MSAGARLPEAPEPMQYWEGVGGVTIAGDWWGDPEGPLVILQHGGGQTRPRLRADDLPEIAVPDPGPVGRALVDRLVAEAHDARAAARERLDAVTALYHRFGCGELDEDELIAALRALVTAPQGAQDAGE